MKNILYFVLASVSFVKVLSASYSCSGLSEGCNDIFNANTRALESNKNQVKECMRAYLLKKESNFFSSSNHYGSSDRFSPSESYEECISNLNLPEEIKEALIDNPPNTDNFKFAFKSAVSSLCHELFGRSMDESSIRTPISQIHDDFASAHRNAFFAIPIVFLLFFAFVVYMNFTKKDDTINIRYSYEGDNVRTNNAVEQPVAPNTFNSGIRTPSSPYLSEPPSYSEVSSQSSGINSFKPVK